MLLSFPGFAQGKRYCTPMLYTAVRIIQSLPSLLRVEGTVPLCYFPAVEIVESLPSHYYTVIQRD